VNRQVSDEALEMLYSSFSFHFPNYVDVALVNATLRDTLSAGARSLISSIGLVMSLFLRRTPGPFAHSDDEKVRQAFEAVVKLLPNVRRVQLTLSLGGFKVPDYQVKEVVNRAMRKASPLRDIAGLVLGGTTETAQRMRIMSEVREALGCLWASCVEVTNTLLFDQLSTSVFVMTLTYRGYKDADYYWLQAYEAAQLPQLSWYET